MTRLSTADATDTFGRPLVGSLLQFAPAERRFELTYDVERTGKVSAYISTSGPDLYFEWDDDYQRGWLVRSYALDVG
ncbi:hypothetical protein LWC33_13015 [Pseudonocardia sp. RS11V-5]|uniref:hypothetical protein n=1 Tax=Pseudonocardia terrae TaxID=2905831 RepID=UPI001E5E06A2|nr:hypothetical protein [Pseudonocardia terrae]MCE3552378.1 hypothetical protein [Pseudonocardia terrae]